MFWHLLLAHFLADFPLQPNWMARQKVRPWVLLLHVLTHFAVMLAVVFPASVTWWLYLLLIGALHFAIDAVKNWFTVHRPQWVTWPYLIDQAAHCLSIFLVNRWAAGQVLGSSPYLNTHQAVAGVGFVLVTFVFLITERVILRGKQPARPAHTTHAWARLVLRAGLLLALLLGWNRGVIAPVGLISLLPYPATGSGLRVLLVDVLVTLLTAALVIFLNGSLL
jgi:hypothetical protein